MAKIQRRTRPQQADLAKQRNAPKLKADLTKRKAANQIDQRDVTADPKIAGFMADVRGAGQESMERSMEQNLRQLGVDGKAPTGPAGIGKSRIFELLTKDRFVDVKAVNVPGEVVWVNFELAKQLGYDVPVGHRMTEALHAQLVDSLSFRLLGAGEKAGDNATVTMRADKYGGTGVGNNTGSGRAAFLPWGNLHIKGVGRTPLSYKHDSDFQHSHGGAPMREGMLEAVWGEVNSNLFAHGSSRILAVIDVGDYTRWPNGSMEKRALIIRAGRQVRPAHLIGTNWQGGTFSKEVFVNAARDSGVLVTRKVDGASEPVPDLQATMRRFIDHHALTAAEQFRWRMIHGAISTSNMELDGGMLDLATQSSQSRTAPLRTLGHGGSFGKEQVERATELSGTYSTLVNSLSRAERAQFNAQPIDFRKEMELAYRKQLELQLLHASGLKSGLAEALRSRGQLQGTEGVTRFSATLLELAALRNPGDTLADKKDIHDVAVVDVFNLLRRFPEIYFAKPEADHRPAIRKLLKPLLKGSDAGQTANRQKLDRLIDRFAEGYREMMQESELLLKNHYDDAAAFRRSVIARAQFENAPIDLLYRKRLNDTLTTAIDSYESNKNATVFSEAVDKAAAASLRNVDALLRQGSRLRLDDGSMELGRRTIDGVHYAVRAWPDGKRNLQVSLTVEGNEQSGYHLPAPGTGIVANTDVINMSQAQLQSIRYRYTTDGWKGFAEAPGKLQQTPEGLRLVFEMPVLRSEVGQLEGLFHITNAGEFWIKDGASNFRGYAFAVPDNLELNSLNNPR